MVGLPFTLFLKACILLKTNNIISQPPVPTGLLSPFRSIKSFSAQNKLSCSFNMLHHTSGTQAQPPSVPLSHKQATGSGSSFTSVYDEPEDDEVLAISHIMF